MAGAIFLICMLGGDRDAVCHRGSFDFPGVPIIDGELPGWIHRSQLGSGRSPDHSGLHHYRQIVGDLFIRGVNEWHQDDFIESVNDADAIPVDVFGITGCLVEFCHKELGAIDVIPGHSDGLAAGLLGPLYIIPVPLDMV